MKRHRLLDLVSGLGTKNLPVVELGHGRDTGLLRLPAVELATKVMAVFGMRGAGKSNLMGVVAEGLLSAGIQFIVLDPVGIWFSLALRADGKGPSIFREPSPLLAVLGGKHGDIALPATAGNVVGRALATSSNSCVLDISAMSKGERTHFATDFIEAFFEGKKDNPSPTMLALEESQRFIPQVIRFKGSGQEQMLGAFEEYAEQARNYGGGLIMAALRPQKVNKEVVNLADIVIACRTKGVHERKAIKEWVQEKDAPGRDEIDGELPSLPDGTGFVWAPGLLPFGRCKFHKKSTYDAGATPLVARAAVKLKPLDLSALEAQMAAVVERVRADDPKLLRARIVELERQQQPTKVLYEVPREVREALTQAALEVEAASKAMAQLETTAAKVKYHFGVTANLVSGSRIAILKGERVLVGEPGQPHTQIHKMKPAPVGTQPNLPVSKQPMGAGPIPLDGIKRGARRMLSVMVAMARPLTWPEVSVLSGVALNSGTFGQYKSALRAGGFVHEEDNTVRYSSTGEALAIESVPTNGRELLEFWLPRLKGKQREMLQAMYDNSPVEEVVWAQISGGVMGSGTWGQYKSALLSRGLVVKNADKMYVRSHLFDT